jgi:hypothetical protein
VDVGPGVHPAGWVVPGRHAVLGYVFLPVWARATLRAGPGGA